LLKGKFKKTKKKERKVITAVNPIEEDPFASKASIEGPMCRPSCLEMECSTN